MSAPLPSENSLSPEQLLELQTLTESLERACLPVIVERDLKDSEAKQADILATIQRHPNV